MYCLNSFDSCDRKIKICLCGISLIFIFSPPFFLFGEELLHKNRFLKDNIFNCSSFQYIMLSLKHCNHFQEKPVVILHSRTLWIKVGKPGKIVITKKKKKKNTNGLGSLCTNSQNISNTGEQLCFNTKT